MGTTHTQHTHTQHTHTHTHTHHTHHSELVSEAVGMISEACHASPLVVTDLELLKLFPPSAVDPYGYVWADPKPVYHILHSCIHSAWIPGTDFWGRYRVCGSSASPMYSCMFEPEDKKDSFSFSLEGDIAGDD